MRHRPLLAKYSRSALSGQGNPCSEIPCRPARQQQWRQTSTVRLGSNASQRQGSNDATSPHTGVRRSQTSTKIPVHGRQRYHDVDEDDHGRSCLIHIDPQPTSTFYTTAILSYLLREFGSVLEFMRLDSSKPEPPASPAGKAYRASFTQPKSLSKALNASPLKLHVDGNGITRKSSNVTDDGNPATSPPAPQHSTLDPYSVFGLKDRHLPSPCTFTCTLERAPAPGTELLGTSPPTTRPALLSHKDFHAQQESLIASGMPKSLAGAFALQPGEVPLEDELTARVEQDEQDQKDKAEKDLWFAR